jgi:hypothetical protein
MLRYTQNKKCANILGHPVHRSGTKKEDIVIDVMTRERKSERNYSERTGMSKQQVQTKEIKKVKG